ncbi:MAG: hypothetical protein LBJ36_11475 [Synergistaceae bacterium]|jgi:hypothetical protein|nr:hypothetical protein [Synergistaceae bacterium]
MGNLSNQILAITTEVQTLSSLVQTFLNAQGQNISVDQIKSEINKAVATAVVNVMQQLEGLDVSIIRSDIDLLIQGISKAMLSAGLAHKDIEALTSKYIQHGTAVIRLFGVQSGCVVTRSTTATRNLNLSAGTLFKGHQIMAANEQLNGTSIPNNPTSATQVCEVYMINDGFMDFRSTPFGETTPEEGWPLYSVSVPAGNTEANEQYLAKVTLTSIRKLESNCPAILTAEPFVYVPLPYVVPDPDYAVILEAESDIGSAWELGDIYAKDKTVNGFKIATNGICDRLKVRWTLISKKGTGTL